jgi:hypothetical protein
LRFTGSITFHRTSVEKVRFPGTGARNGIFWSLQERNDLFFSPRRIRTIKGTIKGTISSNGSQTCRLGAQGSTTARNALLIPTQRPKRGSAHHHVCFQTRADPRSRPGKRPSRSLPHPLLIHVYSLTCLILLRLNVCDRDILQARTLSLATIGFDQSNRLGKTDFS